jgi:pyruvate dehydrogenase E1 component alpha subunit/2-oxoisovalerate dehydrogenase E1 component alpha subunit
MPMISHLCAMIPVINGALMSKRFRGESGAVGAVSIGEGATSTGAFHEGLNQAAVEQLPLVLVVANNQYAYSTPNSRQFACADLVDKAIGYGVQGWSVDGTDLGECLRVVGGAIETARAGGGPQLVIASLLRLVGHGEHDDAHYINAELKKSPLGRDCLQVAEAAILRNGWATTAMLEEWSDRSTLDVEEAVAMTSREALPNPSEEIWCALSSRHLADGFTNE